MSNSSFIVLFGRHWGAIVIPLSTDFCHRILFIMPNQVLTIEPQNELKFKGKFLIVLILWTALGSEAWTAYIGRELAADKWSFYFQISAFCQGAVFYIFLIFKRQTLTRWYLLSDSITAPVFCKECMVRTYVPTWRKTPTSKIILNNTEIVIWNIENP